MNTSKRRRLLWILVVVLVAVVAGAVAYTVGLNNGRNGMMTISLPGRMGRGYLGDGSLGWFGFLGPLVLISLFVGLLVLIFAGSSASDRRPSLPAGDTPPTSGVDQLKELADLHARGALSDEEFTAAKRRLLGL